MSIKRKTLESRKGNAGLLNRLRSDASGNVIAMMAAAMVPVVGFVGAGLDLSRIYLTKTRLQAACDAGALAAKKEMGEGNYTTAVNNIANQMFNANFQAGTAGSENVTKSFRAIGTAVEGTASADVPMTLLKLFGNNSDDVDVLCRADAGTQNVDVMMVLDNTGSMAWCASGSSGCTGADTRIGGLKRATKCFYETVTHLNSAENCGTVPDGKARTAQVRIGFVPYSTNVNVGKILPNSFLADKWKYQSRVWQTSLPGTGPGVVTVTEVTETQAQPSPGSPATIATTGNYSTTATNLVNASSIWLDTQNTNWVCTSYKKNGECKNGYWETSSTPNADFIAPTTSQFTFSTESLPTNANAASNSWVAATSSLWVPPTNYAFLNAVPFVESNNVINQTQCQARNTSSPFNTLVNIETVGSPSTPVMTTINPVYPNTTIIRRWTQTQQYQATRYKWQWETANVTYRTNSGYGNNNIITTSITGCRRYSQESSTFTQTATWDYNAAVTWNPPGTATAGGITTTNVTNSTATVIGGGVAGWRYKQVEHTVSGLKAGGSSWNNSVSLPLDNGGTNTSIAWDGCIEERQTYRDTDGNIAGDWSPNVPSSAYDMDLKLLPSSADPATQWGPALKDAVWGRYTQAITTSNVSGRQSRGNNWTLDDVVTTSGLNLDLVNPVPDPDPAMSTRNQQYACPKEGRLLKVWGAAGQESFDSYVDGMTPAGNTYHDIGLIWGGRFLVDQGIFRAENPAYYTATNGKVIERHLVFMTDGETATNITNYAAYGLPWWDRRQTRAPVTDPNTNAPTATELNSLVDERMSALCRTIKNNNVTIWVIAFGANINASTPSAAASRQRLNACATSSSHFYTAADNAALTDSFSRIGGQIGGLRIEE